MLAEENINEYTPNVYLCTAIAVASVTMLWVFGNKIAKNLCPQSPPEKTIDLFSKLNSKDKEAIIMAVIAYHDYYKYDHTSFPEHCSKMSLEELIPSILSAIIISNSLTDICGIAAKDALYINVATSTFNNTNQTTSSRAPLEILAANILCKMQPIQSEQVITLEQAQQYLFNRPIRGYHDTSRIKNLLTPQPHRSRFTF